jgi:DNA-binding MarR family transcriptional regulator
MTTTRSQRPDPRAPSAVPTRRADVADDELVAHWHQISSGVQRVQQRIDRAVADIGVPAQWIAVLHALLHTDDHQMQMTALARKLSMTTGGCTKLADRMVDAGLLARRASATDRRVVNAILTESGLVMAQESARAYRAAVRKHLVTAGVGPLEVASIATMLRAVDADHNGAAGRSADSSSRGR